MRDTPKRARTLIRKTCDRVQAKSLTYGETSIAAKKIASSWSCWCGAAYQSKAALDGHRGTAHGISNVATWFAPTDNACGACLVEFSNRSLLLQHLTCSTYGTCLLHAILRNPSVSSEELEVVRKSERKEQSRREKAGLPCYLAEKPPFRRSGPLPQLIGLDGLIISMKSNALFFGPQKRKYIDREQDD